jgi:hypothetical protein
LKDSKNYQASRSCPLVSLASSIARLIIICIGKAKPEGENLGKPI